MTIIKIAFMGTQSTGKTSRAKKMSKADNLLLVTEAARSCPLPINRQATKEAQIYIFTTQLQREIEEMAMAENFDMGGIVCDRSLLDSLVYSADRGFSDLVDLLLPFIRKWLKTYSKLFWCRPAPGSSPELDGVRCADWIWQKQIDKRFETFIEDILCLNVEIIQDKEIKCPHINLNQGKPLKPEWI